MNTLMGVSMDHDKVSVSINKIENGYLINRSWCEKAKNEEGEYTHDYKSETYYLASLPQLIAKLFVKGSNAKDMGGKTPDGNDEYDKAIMEMKKKGAEGSGKEEEEEEEEEY